MPSRWRGPRPDPTVIELLENLTAAARNGQVRGLVVVTVNPLLNVETAHAGDLDNVKTHLLIGGCHAAAAKLTKPQD